MSAFQGRPEHGLHCLGDLSPADVRDQDQRTQDAVTEISGMAPVLFRAPYGDFTDTALAICANLALHPVSWSVDPTDWSNTGTDTIVARVLAGAATGAVVLTTTAGKEATTTRQRRRPLPDRSRPQPLPAMVDKRPLQLHHARRSAITHGPSSATDWRATRGADGAHRGHESAPGSGRGLFHAATQGGVETAFPHPPDTCEGFRA
ncbi:hypothetical protein GCM10009665_25070 [Kitasatospora nipponensis]|uniref:NodB homology domain-containing protein n=1 Tax=Kitasatospora nipponensis TaxID=258049 RepID=A0ABN1W7I8_9ACTN